MAMSLTNEDLQQVGTYVRAHLTEWLPWNVLDLSERIVRVEEELKSQGRRMDERFDAVDKRFEDMHRHTNRWMTIISLALVMLGALMTWFNVAG